LSVDSKHEKPQDVAEIWLAEVAFAFWQGGWWPGVATATTGAATWLIADLSAGHQYTHYVIPHWNALVRGLTFFAVGILLVRLKRELVRETHLAGDALLVSVASALQDAVRTFDCIARLGGDEIRLQPFD
jgi:hypothetical protein